MATDFSFNRFSSLVRRDLMGDMSRQTLQKVISAGGIIALVGILMSLQYSAYPVERLRGALTVDLSRLHSITSAVMVIVMTACINEKRSAKGDNISWLMLPATQLEKFASLLVRCFVTFPIMYVAIWLVSEVLRMLVMGIFFSAPFMIIFPRLGDFFFDNDGGGVFAFLLFQTFFLLGAFVFGKNALRKTVFTGILLSIFYSLVFLLAVEIFFDYDFVKMAGCGNAFSDKLEGAPFVWYCVNYGFNIVMIIVNLVLSYYRFKESEIIHRY